MFMFMPCRMQKLAKELGVVIPVSFFEEANNAHYNSVAIIDADGTDLGLYRKSHIPDSPGMQIARCRIIPSVESYIYFV
jgi:predicted amidohydrolase